MGKGKPERGVAARLGALLEAGDHRAAGAEARRLLDDAGTSEEDRRAAARALASLRPDRAAVLVGLAAVVGALLLTARVLLG